MKMSLHAFILCLVFSIFIISGCSTQESSYRDDFRDAVKLIDEGKKTAGDAKLQKSLEKHSDDPEAYLAATHIYYNNDMLEEAVTTADSLVLLLKSGAIDSEIADVRKAAIFDNLGSLYWEMGDVDGADVAFSSALEITPDDPMRMNNLGYLYADEGINLDKSVALLRVAVEKMPSSAMVLDSMGWALYKIGKYEESLKYMEDAVTNNPNMAELRYHLGVVLVETGDVKRAKIELGKALYLDDSLTEANLVLKNMEEEAGKDTKNS